MIASQQLAVITNRLPSDRSAFARINREWLCTGCSTRAAAALANAGIEVGDTERIHALGKVYFQRLQNCGPRTVKEIGALIGGWPEEAAMDAQSAIARALALSLPPDQAQDAAGDAVVALHRAGFTIVSADLAMR